LRRWHIEDSVGFLAWSGVRLLGVVLRQPEKTFSTASVKDGRDSVSAQTSVFPPNERTSRGTNGTSVWSQKKETSARQDERLGTAASGRASAGMHLSKYPRLSSLISHNRNSSYACGTRISFNGRLMF
jgi:hypothetical protein